MKAFIQRLIKHPKISAEQRRVLFEALLSLKSDSTLLAELNELEMESLVSMFEDEEMTSASATIYTDDDEQSSEVVGTPFPSPQTNQTIEINTLNTLHVGLVDEEATGSSKVGQANFTTPYDFGGQDRYLDLGLLGRGAMGEVRRVRDQFLKRTLAMKIIHSKLLGSHNIVSRFIEEAQIEAQLQHPNIVPVYDIGELPDKRLFFTMKEIKGREFTKLIDELHHASTVTAWKMSDSGLTFRRVINLFLAICETMAYSHEMGVVHRDLKPENVMVGDFGEVLVVDWGIAKVIGSDGDAVDEVLETVRGGTKVSDTRVGIVTGSPSYMSPEQAMGRNDLIAAQSDVYSLGTILYEILSGTPPFTGATVKEVVDLVKTAEPEPLVAKDGKIPRALIDVCERAMQREAKDRFPTAKEMAKEITDWLEGAQRREKALKEVQKAEAVETEAKRLEEESANTWFEAERSFSENGHDSLDGWTLWERSKKSHRDSLALKQKYKQTLLGALVHDLELEEANERLAILLIEDLTEALASGDLQRQEILKSQIDAHLRYLSKEKRNQFHEILSARGKDVIALLRARRGAIVGRKRLCRDIAAELNSGTRLVTLVGTAGVGKTRLALEVIHLLRESKGQSNFCDLTEATTELGMVTMVAKSMNVKLREQDPIGQLGEIFSQRPTTLVLDNLEQVAKPAGAVIERWLKQSDSLKVIGTSRVRLQIPEEKNFSVQPLSKLEAMELFALRGRQAEPTFTLNESVRTVVGRIVSQLDSLPLAIELAAARLNIFSVEEVENRLAERFSLLRSRNDERPALSGALDWSWELLKPWSKAVLSQASVFRGGFDTRASESILHCGNTKEAPPIFDILQDLSEDSLLRRERSAEGEIRYVMLESIRQYSQSRLLEVDAVPDALSGPEFAKATSRRHAQHYSRFGERTFLSSLESVADAGLWQTLYVEMDNLIAGSEGGAGESAALCCKAALTVLSMKGPVSLGIEMATNFLERNDLPVRRRKEIRLRLTRFLRISGRVAEAREARVNWASTEIHTDDSTSNETVTTHQEDASRVDEIEVMAERLFEADKYLESGNIEEVEALYDQAMHCYSRALAIYEEVDYPKGVITCRQKMATVYQNQGAYDAALEELEKALSLAETNNFGFLKAEIYSILGQVYENKGAYQKALESLNVALELNRKIGNRYGEGQNLGSIGLVHKNQRQPEQALLIFKQAIEIAQQIGNKRLEGTQIGNLGTVYQMLRRYDESVVHYKEAIDIAKEIGDRKEEGRNVGNLGIVYGAMREYDTAIEHYRESIKIAQEIGDRKREGIQIGDLGRLFFQLGRFDDAITNCKRALGIAEEIGVMNTAKTLLRLLTLIYQNIGHYDVAIHYCKRALLVIKELQLTSFESFQMGTLGFLYSEVGAYEKAVSSYGSSIKIARESGNKEGEGLNLGNLGDTLLKTGRYDESKEALIGAIDIFKAVKYDHAVGVFQGSLALLLASQGRFEEATELLDSSEAHVKVDANEHGKFLCKKARVLLLMEDHDGARQVLAEAENIAQANNASQISELGRLITGIRDELNPEMGMKSLSEEQIEDVKIEADEIFEMGKIEASQSNHELALRSYRQSVILFKKIQDPVGTLSVKLKMVKTDRERGAFKEALTQAVGMLHVVEKHNLKHMKSKVYLEMALGYLELGQREEAIVACEAALKENRNVEDLRLESQTLSLMGDVFCLMSNHGEALGCYEQSNHLAEKVGNTGQTIRNLNGLATAHASLGNTESAILHYKDAVEKSRLSKNFSEAAFTLGALGETLMEQERWKEARACLEEAIELCGETEHRHVFGTFRGLLALWYALQADFSSATNLIANCENHFGSSSSSGDIEAQVIFLCNKSKVCHLQGKSEEARNMLQMARDLSASINPRPKIILDGRIAKTMVFLNGGTE